MRRGARGLERLTGFRELLTDANYGLGVIPSSVDNLRNDSQAEVTYRYRTVCVRAREVTGDEAEKVFAAACRIFPGYAVYRERFPEPVPAFALGPLG